MKTFTWSCGSLVAGLVVTPDPDGKLGQVVFLGEAGRGRHWEKVSLARRNPAEVVDGKVTKAVFGSFDLPARDGKPKKTIYNLEREPMDEGRKLSAAIVRIKTDSGYRKNSHGHFVTIAGEPSTVITGHGAEGLAGRAGGWSDSLVVMTEGDVIKVIPTRDVGGISNFAIWMEKGGEVKTASWAQYENMQAKSKVEAFIADAKGEAESSLTFVAGWLSCVTYVGRGEFKNGIEVTTGTTGPAVILGEEGRGRVRTEVPIVGFEAGQFLTDIAVVELSRDEKPAAYSWEKPMVKVIYGLTDGGNREENGGYLVRVRPSTSPHRSYIRVEKLRGEPIMVARGNFASGIAGNAGSADDALYVLRPGDALHLEKRVIENVYGELQAQSFADWELADATANPVTYIEKGRAPVKRIPAEWIGKIVKINNVIGELVSLNPLALNLGWDGKDRKVVNVTTDSWVEIQPHCNVRVLEGDELMKREVAKAKQARLVEIAKAIYDGDFFGYLDSGIRAKITRVADAKLEVSWRDEDFDASLATTDEITAWNVWAEAILAEVEMNSQTAIELAQRVQRKEILVNWKVWHREGASTDLGKGWVIRSDGTCREADSNDFTRRSQDGNCIWRQVEADELAISWKKAYTAAPHEFTVNKLPVGGPTKAQLETVERIEKELSECYFYVGEACAQVGKGWGLKPEPKPQPVVVEKPSGDVRPLSAAELKAQLGGGRIKLGQMRR